jgi:hypothetical protein
MMKSASIAAIAGALLLCAHQARAQTTPPVEQAPTSAEAGAEATSSWQPSWSRNTFSFRVEGTFAYHELWDHSIYSGGARFAAGVQFRRVLALYGQLDELIGVTEDGLGTQLWQFGPSVELLAWRIRFAFGVQVAYLAVKRAVNDDYMYSLGAAVTVSMALNLLQRPAFDLYLGVTGGGTFFENASLPTFNAALGARFRSL